MPKKIKQMMKATNLKLMESTTLKFGLSSCIHKNNDEK